MRMLSAIVAALLCAVLAASCNRAQYNDPQLGSERQAVLQPPDNNGGNGPYMTVVCRTPNGSGDCGSVVSTAATFNTALTPPAAAFDSATFPLATPRVHSWNIGNEINLWYYGSNTASRGMAFSSGGSGPVDINTKSYSGGNNPTNYALATAGYLFVPPSVDGNATAKTFAIGSDDGSFFAIQGCPKPTSGDCTGTAIWTATDITAGHAMTYVTTFAYFPASGGIFPFQLAHYQGGGANGLELTWADGEVTTAPAFDTPGPFVIVPKANLYGPDVHAPLSITPGGATVNAGDTLTFTANIFNQGKTSAFPVSGTDSGLTFVLALPTSSFNTGTISVLVNGIAATPAVSTSGPNTLVSVPFKSPLAAGPQLLIGASTNNATVAITAKTANGATGTVRVQGVVKGQATDNAVITGQTVVPAASLFVYTDDPSVVGTADKGNAPAGVTGRDDEASGSGGGNLVTFVSTAYGNTDDNPASFTIGSTAVGTPAIAAPTGTISTATKTAFNGTEAGPTSTPLAVTLSGLPQAACVAGTGPGAAWNWVAAGNLCYCLPPDNAGIWTCRSLSLLDCPAGTPNCYTLTAEIFNGADIGMSSSLSFGTAAPVATVSSPANASTVNTHSFTPSGTASDGLGNALGSGFTVNVTVGGVVACTATTIANGTWTCSSPVQVNTDGAYSAFATVQEDNGAASPAGATNNFTVSTRPSITAPTGGLTNSRTPAFGGGKIGDGPEVRVCLKGVDCTQNGNIKCAQTGIASGTTTWTCTPGSNLTAGAGTFVAYEVDGAGNLSAPSSDFALFVNTANPTWTNVPASKTFNLNNSIPKYRLMGACVSGETVSAVFNDTGATACSTTPACASGAWQCDVTFPVEQQVNLHLVITQTAGDSTTRSLDTSGIIIDLVPPVAATVNAPAMVNAAGANPPAIGGTGENGATVTATANGTLRGTSTVVTASCTSSTLVIGGNWSCTSWTGTAINGGKFRDGAYTLTALETDNHGNAQTAAANTAPMTVKQQAPPAPAVTLPAFVGIAGPNPPVALGLGEAGDVLKLSIIDGGSGMRTCTATVPADGGINCAAWSNNDAGFPEGGPYGGFASQSDSLGNGSPDAGVTGFTVILTPPQTPVIDGPADGGYTTLSSPSISVLAQQKNGTMGVTVKDSGNVTAGACPSVAVPSSGDLHTSCGLSGLANGLYMVQAVHTDQAGNTSPQASSTFNVDKTTPQTPSMTAPTSPTSNTTPLLSGTGYPLSTVTVNNGTNQICMTTVQTDKTWSCTPTTPLGDLDYSLIATGSPPNGNGTSTPPVSLSVYTLAKPSISVAASTTVLKPVITVTLTGAAMGQVVTVFDGSTPFCRVTLSSSASSLQCAAANYLSGASLQIGDHSLTAQVTDATHRSLASAAAAVAILPLAPQLDTGATFGTSQPLLTGTMATPLSQVTVLAAANDQVVCKAQAAADGSFSCQVGTSPAGATLPDGADALSVHALLNGKQSPPITTSVTVSATPAVVPPQSPTKDTKPQLCVALRPGAPTGTTASIIDAGQVLCSATASGGQACCSPATALADGVHLLTAKANFPPGGSSAESASVELRIKTSTAPPVFGPLDNLGSPVTLVGTSEATAQVQITVDGAPLPPVAADATGNWTLAAGALPTGTHTVTAQATDSLGNVSPVVQKTFTVRLAGLIRGASFGCSTSSSSTGALPLLALLALLLRRRSRKAALLALPCALLLLAPAARAQSLGLDSFRPASGGDGLLSVEGARPPQDGEGALQLRLWMQGQSRPLMFIPDSGGSPRALIRNRVGGWASLQVHAAGPFSVVAQLPFLLGQHGDLSLLPSDVTGGSQLGTGLGDVRLTGRLGLTRQSGLMPLDLAVQASAELPTAKADSYLGDSSLQGELLFAAARRFGPIDEAGPELIGNAFFRLRPSRQLLGVKEGSQLGLRGGLAWVFASASPFVPARVLAEVEGAPFLRAGFSGGSVPSEWRAGGTYCLGSVVAVDLGVGGALASGIGTPGLRMLGALSFGSPACGHSMRSEPIRPPPLPPRIVAAKPLPAVVPGDTPPELAVTPPPAEPKDHPLEVPTDEPAPKQGKRAPAVAVAEPPPSLPDLLALPSVPERPAARAEAPPPLPALPPLEDAPARKRGKKKERIVAQVEAPALPDLADLTPSGAASPLDLPSFEGVAVAGDRIALARPIGFQGNSPRLARDGRKLLDEVARLLSSRPELAVQVAGHADTDATAGLAQARAETVAAYLRNKGIDASRLMVESFGTSRPLLPGISKTARRKNLRVELNLVRR